MFIDLFHYLQISALTNRCYLRCSTILSQLYYGCQVNRAYIGGGYTSTRSRGFEVEALKF
jgi:hypothetical protein